MEIVVSSHNSPAGQDVLCTPLPGASGSRSATILGLTASTATAPGMAFHSRINKGVQGRIQDSWGPPNRGGQ
jgi:hypothetical protein